MTARDAIPAGTGTQEPTRSEQVVWGRLPGAAVLAAVIAAAVNALIYLAASELGAISESVLLSTPSGEQPLTLGPVVTASIVGVAGAAIVFALLGRFTARPVTMFRVVATVVLALSLIGPATISNAPIEMILSLMLMHVVVWAVSVGLLSTLAARRSGAEGVGQ